MNQLFEAAKLAHVALQQLTQDFDFNVWKETWGEGKEHPAKIALDALEAATAYPEQRDIVAKEITGVQIGTLGHKLWVCVDGACVLRVRTPKIELTDQREDYQDTDTDTEQ